MIIEAMPASITTAAKSIVNAGHLSSCAARCLSHDPSPCPDPVQPASWVLLEMLAIQPYTGQFEHYQAPVSLSSFLI